MEEKTNEHRMLAKASGEYLHNTEQRARTHFLTVIGVRELLY